MTRIAFIITVLLLMPFFLGCRKKKIEKEYTFTTSDNLTFKVQVKKYTKRLISFTHDNCPNEDEFVIDKGHLYGDFHLYYGVDTHDTVPASQLWKTLSLNGDFYHGKITGGFKEVGISTLSNEFIKSTGTFTLNLNN